MATVFHPSVLASDVFGSAGDVTAVHRDGKVYLRKRRAAGSGELTPAQSAHLEVHRRALAAWRDLPHAVQEEWNEYAREVEPHRPPFDHSSWISGQNLFVSAYHGFHTLGMEKIPSPLRFEPFPPFAVVSVVASVVEDELVLRLAISGVEYAEGARYWLYGKVRLSVKGGNGRARWKSVLASGPFSSSEVLMVIAGWSELWPDLKGSLVAELKGSFVLLDAVTGYRSHRRGCVCEVNMLR